LKVDDIPFSFVYALSLVIEQSNGKLVPHAYTSPIETRYLLGLIAIPGGTSFDFDKEYEVPAGLTSIAIGFAAYNASSSPTVDNRVAATFYVPR